MPRLKRPPKGERLGRASIMVYTPDGRVGSFQANEYQRLITTAVTKEVTAAVEKATREATQAATKKKLKDAIAKGLQEGKNIEDILREL